MYQGRLTVDGLVEQMVACRQGSPRDRQLFQAILNVIYEEFQFLHNFPDKELQMTAQVLASLVSIRTALPMTPKEHVLDLFPKCGTLATEAEHRRGGFPSALYRAPRKARFL